MVNEGIERILRSYPQTTLARGRTYAAEGRVTALEENATSVSAVVTGTQDYQVLLREARGKTLAQCTCPAYEGDRRCKHIAAVAWTISARQASSLSTAGPQKRGPNEPVPAVFRHVYSTSTFLSRLALYTGQPVRHDADEYLPLADWWWSAMHGRQPAKRALAKQVTERASEVVAVLESLRSWQVPPSPLPRTSGFTHLYVKLAKVYEDHAKNVVVGSALPGPLDGRHPGFAFEYESTKRLVAIREKPAVLIHRSRCLTVQLPFDEPGQPISFADSAFAAHGATDAWDLFALREMLKALHARTDPVVQQLERDLDRPIWEHVLEHLFARQGGTEEPREWRFTLVPGHRDPILEIIAHARKPSAGAKAKWKRERFTALLTEEVTPIEREIGRLALHRGDRTSAGGRLDPHYVTLGTPLAYDLLRLLARHQRVFVSDSSREGSADAEAEITAGLLTMTLERAPSGALVPRFRVDGAPLRFPLEWLNGERWSLFRWIVRKAAIVALEIPAALRPWLELSTKLGDALAFPSEAIPRLTSATEALMSAGIVELPRVALGEELPYAPAPALRVEWKTDAREVDAVIEVMIKVHPRAPFAPAGSGPKLFTFEDEGRRVYVERDLGRELQIAGDTVDAIDVEGLHWDRGVGHAGSVEAAIALASFLARNALGLPIEVKVGRPPVVQSLPGKAKIVVRRIGAWLRLDGSFDEGIKLTLGELLEAVRLAQRYVRAGDGVFIELSKAAIAKLRPLAMATQLAPAALASATEERASALLHDGFGALLAQAAELFESVRGESAEVDLDEYVRRYDRRDRHVHVPALENGTLRDYQHDGVAWMLRLSSWAPGCVLADDMGLGKTIQTAAVLKARAKHGPALVISPASVSSNWVSELERFMPSLAVRWYNEDRTTPLAELGAGDVLVVSYGLLQRESAAFRARHWPTVVVDEAQYVKNIEAQRSDAVRNLPRSYTIALTGTPLENHLGELFSVVDIAFPGLLGDEPSFREHFRRPIEAHRDTDRLAALGLLLGPFLLRRTRASVLDELPARQEITERLELSLPERKRYLALRNECAKALESQRRGTTPSQLRIALLAALTRLRQMACDVRLVDPDYDGPSTKIAHVVELVQQLAAEGNRALVFSQFTQFLGKVRVALQDADLRVAMLTGETPTTERKAIIDAFQEGDYDAFCISLLAGGTGLNLTKASYVIHLDPWWNPAVEEQATARAHRMGQKNPVTVYRMVARGTIEEAVLAMHAEKRELASSVLEGKGNPKQITSDELLELLRFGG
jgi:superfamily II DNA or RNA helicase